MRNTTKQFQVGKMRDVTSVLVQTGNIQQLVCNVPGFGISHVRQQDAWLAQAFEHESRQVFVGAVSDGCTDASTDDFGGHKKTFTEHGSRWLVEEFFTQTQKQYQNGLRGKNLMRATLLGVVGQMEHYKPKNNLSEFIEAKGGVTLSNELVATLFAYIIDGENCTLAVAGNGELWINGKRAKVDQSGGDLYPYVIYSYLPGQWDKQLENMFTIHCFPTTEVSKLALSTDGLKDTVLNSVASLNGKPLEKACLKTGQELVRAGGSMDDCTLVAWINSQANHVPTPGWLTAFAQEASSKNFQAFRSGQQTDRMAVPLQAKSALPKSIQATVTDPAPSQPAAPQRAAQTPPVAVVAPTTGIVVATNDFIPLTELCDYDSRIGLGYGPRHICEVLLRVREALTAMHARGQYAGNLRPQDVAVKFNRLTEQQAQAFGEDPGLKYLHNTYLRAEVKLEPAGKGQLDRNFVLPKLWDKVNQVPTDTQAQVNNDCYQFAVLAWWLLSTADPFGEGVPKDPSHNRSNRMDKNHCYWNEARVFVPDRQRFEFLSTMHGRWDEFEKWIYRTLDFERLPMIDSKTFKLFRDHGFVCQDKGGTQPGKGCEAYLHPSTTRCPCCKCIF